MTRSKLFSLAAILSAAIATPVLATGETATRPWSAPVGHRQPRAADIPPSVSPQTLDQEDINVAKKFNVTIICWKFGARSSGLTTVCYYDCGGSEAATYSCMMNVRAGGRVGGLAETASSDRAEFRADRRHPGKLDVARKCGRRRGSISLPCSSQTAAFDRADAF
jgi:hypothetical protein